MKVYPNKKSDTRDRPTCRNVLPCCASRPTCRPEAMTIWGSPARLDESQWPKSSTKGAWGIFSQPPKPSKARHAICPHLTFFAQRSTRKYDQKRRLEPSISRRERQRSGPRLGDHVDSAHCAGLLCALALVHKHGLSSSFRFLTLSVSRMYVSGGSAALFNDGVVL